ncbi:synaptic vesicle glycoprotein 2C [Helicoverpa armigera]|uniref:synaptic vesicle glycoprotein 2C n=1 Tax=Helicoverpa armigera TaxID=29058 RepID=UPI0021130381|nr:synaptic vesicle glycoprotein 2C isoform X1 [Helicoverpa armigera]XP_049700404.1 synaptic vesicle glycoprotein 2C isoform X2 [Helicoverpa armigera]XP_049700410.1 synaptic vesicle glycoprotein 2C isoform X3 [Helicoverpa armigera]XP_049700413.1 synaptic vesicle glycoprotein 2C isoform X1 [Helicoverpa armigera]XP_049700421.1 synaptic vesicle glycoprotein 2C isoform X4 [Helicoverpa armigera]XP_049700425.1 synaptic vesicle glycoprotein 2C isoform X1 [Helicoverpa armigera]XP_049700432.1 synaptic
MAEEHACLVRARSDSEGSSKHSFGTMTYTEDRLSGTESGGGEPGNTSHMAASPPDAADANESGELLDYNDSSVLEQFHEDALRQAGCGLSQARVTLAVFFAIAGASLELAAIPFILPSAEIELCILPHEKNWLVMISLVGGSIGAAGWGALSERLGRRRCLLSCLAVNAVFAAIAAFMPTYGTFMMARFCSAIGSGGIVPISYTYIGEVCAGGRRAALSACAAAAAAGSLLAAALAAATLPQTGATTLIENKEHFSAWHRYLLLCTLPILASLVSLIWTQESPRYLLDAGREVDAMMVYQSIHSSNKVLVCGVAVAGAAEYRLGELALPGKRRPPALHHCRHSVSMFWQSFFQLFSSPYRNTTLSLGGMLLFTMAIQYYLASYVPASVVKMDSDLFEASKKSYGNDTYTDVHYNTTLENIEFYNMTFNKCTIKDLLMSHVAFKNCSFNNVALSNIKTSFTTFEGCLFVNSTIIDTDMEVGRELDEWCTFTSTIIRGMRGGCSRHADLTSRLGGMIAEQSYVSHAMFVVVFVALLPTSMRPPVAMCGACILLSPLVYIAQSETALYVVEAVYRFFIAMVFYIVGVTVVNTYPHNLRCTAHGLILSVTYMGCAIVRGAGDGGALVSALLCAALGAAATGAALAANLR